MNGRERRRSFQRWYVFLLDLVVFLSSDAELTCRLAFEPRSHVNVPSERQTKPPIPLSPSPNLPGCPKRPSRERSCPLQPPYVIYHILLSSVRTVTDQQSETGDHIPGKRTFGAVETPPDEIDLDIDDADACIPRSPTHPYANQQGVQDSEEEIWQPNLFYEGQRK
jgi:hypothetical protein